MSAYYNDNEHFCAQVLRMNIQRGLLPEGFVDERSITEVTATDLVEHSHIHLFAGIGGFEYGLSLAGVSPETRLLTGGFPCQDISLAGPRKGLAGRRSGLWYHMRRLIDETIDCGMGPDYIIVENVPAILLPIRENGKIIAPAPASRVLGDLAECGYDAIWRVFSSAEFGGSHLRERFILVAYPNSQRQPRRKVTRSSAARWQRAAQQSTRLLQASLWLEVSTRLLCGMDDGLPSQLDTAFPDTENGRNAKAVHALGNSVDPRVISFVGQFIAAREIERGVA